MSKLGYDSSTPPSPAQLEAGKQAGAAWWAFYVGFGDTTPHVYTAAEVAIIEDAGYEPLPIVVLPLTGLDQVDAASFADKAVAACLAVGVSGVVAIDTEEAMREAGTTLTNLVTNIVVEINRRGWVAHVYAGGYENNGQGQPIPGAGPWLPLWGDENEPGPGQAIQYGPATLDGLDVDINHADEHFQLASWVSGVQAPIGGEPAVAPSKGPLAAPIVGIAQRPQADGYWLVGADGGVFTFGKAPFHGALTGQHLVRPIVGIAAAPDGNGYSLVGSDGGVFTFGSAQYFGSTEQLGYEPAAD